MCLAVGLAVIAGVFWTEAKTQGTRVLSGDGVVGGPDVVVVFEARKGSAITIPAAAGDTEQRAARLLQHTLAKASGLGLEAFPIRAEEEAAKGGIVLAGSNHRRVGEGRLQERVGWRVNAGRVEITSYPAEAIEAAAACFLRETLGARWFMPGAIGEHVPVRKELRLAAGERTYSPSYISRNLGLGGASPDEQRWWGGNRLRRWFNHTHAMNDLFKPEDLRANPDFTPMVNGTKYFPGSNREGNWQPNIAAPGAVEHAAAGLLRRREFSSAIGMNDSIRFDQSEETLRRVGEPKWFRHKPDYSKLVFGFVNEVAKRVPGRYLGAYAYDWAEDTPDFPIERNVVPYLTADRSEWFDPAFAEADQSLIRRWVASGAEVVGLYDYYYGSPYLVPRPTLYAVAQSLPQAHQAGVRAFYAEAFPNWGLDGPKSWLAAEFLWDATAKPEELLGIYYRDFWREAAGPMRAYFTLCDQQWLNQPRPSYWIKYFKDEHQHLLFPVEVRQRLRDLLVAAEQAANTDLTRRRVAYFSTAFAVTEAFCSWEEAKDRLSRLALLPEVDQVALKEAWSQLDEGETRLQQIHGRVVKEAPLAVKAPILAEYLRNDPRKRAAWRLKNSSMAKTALAALKGPDSLEHSGNELLADPSVRQVSIKPPRGSMDLDWVTAGAWRGHGEPYETRRVTLESGGIRFTGCKQETFSQLTKAEPGKWYVARVKARAKVSPGNMSFAILAFQDEAGRGIGLGAVDRLPVGEYTDEVELVVWAQAPANAKWVGLGVRALNQVGDDFVAYRDFSLQVLEP